MNGLSHRNIIARTVIDDVSLIRPEIFHHGLAEILCLRIDAEIRAAFLRLFQPQITDIRNHDALRTQALRRLGYQDSDRSGSQDRNLRTFHISGTLHRVNCHRQRLNHGALIKAHLLRKRRHLGRVDSEVIGRHTSCLKSHYLQFFAEIVFAMTARITCSADHLRLDRHLLSRLPSFYAAPELLDLPRYFVSLGDRIAGKRMLAMVDMDVRSAHADLSDLNQYLILFRLRNRHLPKLNFPRSGHYLLQHCSFSFSIFFYKSFYISN